MGTRIQLVGGETVVVEEDMEMVAAALDAAQDGARAAIFQPVQWADEPQRPDPIALHFKDVRMLASADPTP